MGPMGATWQALTRLESWCRSFTQQETDLQKKVAWESSVPPIDAFCMPPG